MDSLTITQRRREGVIFLTLAGKVTIGATNGQLRDSIKRLVTEGEKNIVLDLSSTTYVDSVGLGEIVAGYSALRRNDGRLALLSVSDRVMDLMMITKLYTVFDVYGSEDEAIASFDGNEEPAAAPTAVPSSPAGVSALS